MNFKLCIPVSQIFFTISLNMQAISCACLLSTTECWTKALTTFFAEAICIATHAFVYIYSLCYGKVMAFFVFSKS